MNRFETKTPAGFGFSFGAKCATSRDDVTLLTLSCPAKINLFLAITGRRADGFHELVSVVAPVDWSDELTVSLTDSAEISFECDDPRVPLGSENLVVRAVQAYRNATGWSRGVHLNLSKRLPMGAGLGGGSSDAAMALRAVDALAGKLVGEHRLRELAVDVGSDCPFFLLGGAGVMRGRGESLQALPDSVVSRLRGTRLLLFKPAFGVNTAWAYGRMAGAAPSMYTAPADAERRLAAWCHDDASDLEAFCFNGMEPAVFSKYVAMPTLFKLLENQYGKHPRMSGSGSACFVILKTDDDSHALEATIRDALGPDALVKIAALQI